MGFIPLPLALLVSRSFTGWLLILRCLLPRLLAYKCDDVFSADQSGDQLSEDPGVALVYVCAAVLLGVIGQHVFIIFDYFLDTICFHVHVTFACLCEQDDHSEGSQQYRSPGNFLCVCQRGQYGGKAL